MACREGLALAGDLGWQQITAPSDCVNAVRSIHGLGMGFYGHIVKEIKNEMTSFQEFMFVHDRQ
jgi:hypothetical protein